MFTTVAYSRNLIFNLLLNEFKCVLHSSRRLHTRTHTRISSGNKEQLVILLEVLHSQLQLYTLIARGKINKNGITLPVIHFAESSWHHVQESVIRYSMCVALLVQPLPFQTSSLVQQHKIGGVYSAGSKSLSNLSCLNFDSKFVLVRSSCFQCFVVSFYISEGYERLNTEFT